MLDGAQDPRQSLPRPVAFRLLQDVCSVSDQLPTKYWLPTVILDASKRISVGGEATIFAGVCGGNAVAIREIFPPPNERWESREGLDVLKVGLSVNC